MQCEFTRKSSPEIDQVLNLLLVVEASHRAFDIISLLEQLLDKFGRNVPIVQIKPSTLSLVAEVVAIPCCNEDESAS